MAIERRRTVPQWLLERLAAGELPRERARKVWGALLASGQGRRLADLQRSNRELLAAYPPGVVACEVARRIQDRFASVEESPGSAGRAHFRWLTIPALATVAVATLLVLAPRPEVTREKGRIAPERPALAVYRKTDWPGRPLGAGTRVRAGDVVQVEYTSAGRRYGVVASVDALGQVTLHLPEQPGSAAALEPGGAHPAPSALELDASPGFERFVFVTADAPFPTSLVVEALRQERRGLPPGLDVAEIVLQKGTP
jgi:hypothetical protein